jgi:hypothetical protein
MVDTPAAWIMHKRPRRVEKLNDSDESVVAIAGQAGGGKGGRGVVCDVETWFKSSGFPGRSIRHGEYRLLNVGPFESASATPRLLTPT